MDKDNADDAKKPTSGQLPSKPASSKSRRHNDSHNNQRTA